MYVSRSETSVEPANEGAFLDLQRQLQSAMKPAQGFRWAMLLRSLDDSSRLASVAMWQSPAHAQQFASSEAAAAAAGSASDEMSPLMPVQEYDVATARGSMTPAAFVGLVDWDVEDASQRKGFTERWNAAFHAIEHKLGSRLLIELAPPSRYAGLHVAQTSDDLALDTLAGKVERREEMGIEPRSISRYEVVLLTEA